MSNAVETIVELIKGTQNEQEAAQVISKHYQKLSEKEAANVVKDMKDFLAGNMKLSELNYWLQERGL